MIFFRAITRIVIALNTILSSLPVLFWEFRLHNRQFSIMKFKKQVVFLLALFRENNYSPNNSTQTSSTPTALFAITSVL